MGNKPELIKFYIIFIVGGIILGIGIPLLIKYVVMPLPFIQNLLKKDKELYYNERPTGDYRHQYFWKRPFLRYPYYFRRPFNNYKQDLYPQRVLEIPPITPGTYQVKYLDSGTMLIPNVNLGPYFEIKFKMKFNPTRTKDDYMLLHKGQADPSPMITFSPAENSITLQLKTTNNGIVTNTVFLKQLNPNKYNEFKWIQNGKKMELYVNNTLKMTRYLNSDPVISQGVIYLMAQDFVSFKDFELKRP